MSFLARTLLLFLVITGGAMACRGQQSGAAQSPPSRVATPPGAGKRRVEPKEFSSQRGRFTILFPGTPTEKDTSVDIIFVGRLDSREYKFAEHPTYYGVIYDDLDDDLEKDAERRNYLMNRMRDGGLSSGPNRRVLSESEVWLGRHPGRALKISIPNGGIIRVRMYAVGRRLYQVSVITLGERSSPAARRSAEKRALKFLDSFRLITPEAGVH